MSIFFHLTELRAQHSEQLSFVAQRLRAKKNETNSLIIFLEACTEQVCHPFCNDAYTLLFLQILFSTTLCPRTRFFEIENFLTRVRKHLVFFWQLRLISKVWKQSQMFQLLPINFFREKAGGSGFDYDYFEARQRCFFNKSHPIIPSQIIPLVSPFYCLSFFLITKHHVTLYFYIFF